MSKLTLLTALLVTTISFGQDDKLTEYEIRKMANEATKPELVYNASAFLQDGYFFYSEILTDKLLKGDPESPNYNYRKGFIELETRHDAKSALPRFKKATSDMHKNFDAYSPKERRAPIDALFHLGRCYHFLGKLDEAIATFNLFKEQSNKKSERILEADLMIKQCLIAKEMLKKPTNAQVINLGEKVNNEYPDYSPTISLDGKSLYYTSRRPWKNGETDIYRDMMFNHFPEDIYESNNEGPNIWTTPKLLPLSSERYNEATVSVSADERRLYVYKDSLGGGDLFYSDIDDGNFNKINHIEDKRINSDAWEPHCTVTPDLQYMYFSSDREGGFGGRDIYRITRLPNGEWSDPINLGPTINTPFDEDSPHIDVNNKTLYFSSNGDKSMGGFDIFYSMRDEDNNWNTAINLGSPINSFDDDIYYTTTADGLKGYFSSFREGGFGEKDIYEVKNDYLGHESVSFLLGKFYKVDGSELPDNLRSELICKSCPDKNTQDLTLKNGNFYTLLQRCQDYTANFYDEFGTLVKTETFNTRCDKEGENIEIEIPLIDYELQIIAIDIENNTQVPDVLLKVLDSQKNQIESLKSLESGVVVSKVLERNIYHDTVSFFISGEKENYLTKQVQFDTILLDQPVILINLKMDKLDIGDDIAKMIDINPIYFDLNKADIRPDAAIELDKIVQVMNDNPKIIIELGSHTDCRASKAYNRKLSDRRAKSSAEYIQKRIDNPKRIYGKGYGESQLVNDCECEGNVASDCSEEEHQENRRTEFKIVEK